MQPASMGRIPGGAIFVGLVCGCASLSARAVRQVSVVPFEQTRADFGRVVFGGRAGLDGLKDIDGIDTVALMKGFDGFQHFRTFFFGEQPGGTSGGEIVHGEVDLAEEQVGLFAVLA